MSLLNDGISVRKDRPRNSVKKVEPEVFNPGKHNIDEVKAYVLANPTEFERIVAAESEGENRVTLIEWLTAPGTFGERGDGSTEDETSDKDETSDEADTEDETSDEADTETADNDDVL